MKLTVPRARLREFVWKTLFCPCNRFSSTLFCVASHICFVYNFIAVLFRGFYIFRRKVASFQFHNFINVIFVLLHEFVSRQCSGHFSKRACTAFDGPKPVAIIDPASRRHRQLTERPLAASVLQPRPPFHAGVKGSPRVRECQSKLCPR